jgi:hypothetical protein
MGIFEGTGGTFDRTMFDNWNRRKVVQRVQTVGMFDRLGLKIESNKTLFELNQQPNLV